MSTQRHGRRAGKLSDRREALLDSVGLTWDFEPKREVMGRPEVVRAVAAKMRWPNLTMRECMLAGGLTEDELNEVRDERHRWRTGYVVIRDRIADKIRKYDSAPRQGPGLGTRVEIERLLEVLNGTDEDRLGRVFGERRGLLEEYLRGAEGRGPDWTEEGSGTARRGKRKRAEEEDEEEDCDDDDDDDESGEEEDEGDGPSRRETARALVDIGCGVGSPRRAGSHDPDGRAAANMQGFASWMESFDMT